VFVIVRLGVKVGGVGVTLGIGVALGTGVLVGTGVSLTVGVTLGNTANVGIADALLPHPITAIISPQHAAPIA